MKIMIAAVALLALFIGIGIVVDQTAAPALPAATHILPPAGVERLPREFGPTVVLQEIGVTPSVANPNAGGNGGAAASWVINQWIPERGYEGGVRSVKRVGAITRVSIEWSDPTIPGEFFIIGEIPGDPGDIRERGLARLDGQIQGVEYIDASKYKPMPTYKLILNNASVISYSPPR